MSKKRSRKPRVANEDGNTKPPGDRDNGAERSTPESTEGGSPAPQPMVNLDAILAQISARLATAGSIALGRAPEPVEPVERMQVVVFVLGGVHYAIEIGHISEVGRQTDISHVPGLADWVLGVINLHGEIVSVVDLARFLELGAPAAGRPTGMVIVAQAADQQIGLMVDGIEQIYTFPTGQVISPPFKVEPNLVRYLRGAVDREGQFVRLLDCERLLLGPQMQQFA